MMLSLKRLLPLFLAAVFFTRSNAQENLSTNSDKFIQLNFGYSPKSIILLGKTPSTQTSILQLNYGSKSKWEVKSFPVYYMISITPYINYNYPKRDQGGIRDVANGFGFSPVGFGIYTPINGKFGIWASTAGGFIIIDRRFPTDEGRKLNYTFELSPKISLQVNKSLSLLLGYKFHHISNAQTGSENPGIDSNFLFFSTHITL